MADLIKVTQLPVIEEQLRSLKEQIELATTQAMSLACTEDTVKMVKEARAALTKKYTMLEDQRKAAKAAIMAPYDAFKAIYKECVTEPFRKADTDLKSKITATEGEIKDRAEEEVRAYFTELAQAERVEWLRYEQAGVRMDMATAKQKSHNKAREQVAAFVTGVAEDVRSIQKMDQAEEIMVEYKQTLSLSSAVGTVFDRHRLMDEEQRMKAEWEATQQAELEVVQRVEAVAPPTMMQEEEKTYTCTFKVHATKPQLKQLKIYMQKEGIKYE